MRNNSVKLDELIDEAGDPYSLVLVAAKRARQIHEYTAAPELSGGTGAPQVHTRSQDPVSIALEELRAGKLKVEGSRTEKEEEVWQ